MSRLTQILYVEDEPDIREVVQLALEDEGFELVSCSSGREAIEKAHSTTPDVILIDVMMPGMDGPTTLLRLRELPHLASIPLIFMTAKVQAREVEQYKRLGAIGVINKPFDAMTLAEQIRVLIGNACD